MKAFLGMGLLGANFVRAMLKKGDQVLVTGTNLKDSTVIIPQPVNADSLYGPSQTH